MHNPCKFSAFGSFSYVRQYLTHLYTREVFTVFKDVSVAISTSTVAGGSKASSKDAG